MDTQLKDTVLDGIRKIESMSEIMEMCFEHMEEYPGSESFRYCMEEIRSQAEEIRHTLIQ